LKVYETLNLFAKDLVIGKHGIWWPGEALKIPFQWGGEIQKYRHLHENSYPLHLLQEEVGLLQWLAARQLAPPIGDWVYFKTVVSDHPGAWWADPCGAYGYRMADANSLPPGALQPGHVDDQLRQIAGELLTGSPGAWNDLNKPGNVINGYLVDVRRSGWDRLQWRGPVPQLPSYQEDRAQLHWDLVREGQFPYKERTHPYQEYHLDGMWHAGEREVVKRAQLLRFAPMAHETVLDIGCQLGGFLQYARLHSHDARGGLYVGLDLNQAYIDLAQRLARANRWNLCYRNVSIEDPATLDWLAELWAGRFRTLDHVLLLSMLKHLTEGETTLWRLVDTLRAQWTYLETNAVKEGQQAPLQVGVMHRHGELLGWSKDRNTRACYRIPVPA
jgi:hypothetical protein